MNMLLHRHKAKYIYVIPEGLRELMSDITREVLRCQPQNMNCFIADYLDALMITRENARVAAKTVENITTIAETVVGLLVNTGMTREEADRVAEATQKAFQRSSADREAHPCSLASESLEGDLVLDIIEECGLTEEEAAASACIIQRAYCLFQQRQQRARDLLHGMVDWRVAARSTMRLYRKLDVTYEEANRAATLIKAAYKGYYTRRTMNRLLGKPDEDICEEEATSKQGSCWCKYEDEEEECYIVDEERVENATVLPVSTVGSFTQRDITSIASTAKTLDQDKAPTHSQILEVIDQASLLSTQPQSVEQIVGPSSSVTKSIQQIVGPSPSITKSAEQIVEPSPSTTKSVEQVVEPSPSPTKSVEQVVAPSPSATKSVEQESVETEVIKAPVDDLQTDASGLTDTERTATTDQESDG